MQHQALSSIFVHQRQPLERTITGCSVEDEVARLGVVLEPSQLIDAVIGAGPRLYTESDPDN
jgi:hypothetical protein